MEEKNRNSGEASSSRREGEGQLKKGYIAGKAPNKETDTEKLIYEFEQQKIELEKLKTELRKAQDSILAEKKLLDSEKRFRTLIELSPCGIAIYQDGLFVYVNPSGLALIGAKVQQQLIGKPVLSIVHPDSKNAVIKRMRLVASGITVPAMEEKLVRLDGTTFEAEVIASLIIYNDRPAGQVIVRDISERKLAEESLHKLNLAINQSQEVILITDKEGIITYINPEFTNLYGYSAEEILGKVTPRILKSGLLSAEAYESFWKDLLKKKNVKAEYKNRRKDGSLIDIEGSADPILDEKGEIIGFLGIQRDITKRKQTEAELHEKETQFRNLADSGLALIWTSGTDKLCNYFNEPWLKFTGRTLEQEMGNGWTEGVHPDDLDRCVQTYVTAFDSHVKFDMEYRIRHVSGEYRWIRDLGTPNYNSSGEFIGYIGHCLDITKHKQAEVALHESQTLYHSFVESMPAGVFRKDSEGRFIFVNSAFCRLEGMKPDEILGRKPCDNLLRLETAGTPNMMTGQQKFSMLGEEHHELIMQTGKTIEIEEEYTKPDGTILYLHVVKSPVFSADGKVVGSQGVQFDVTGRKRAENAIKENEFALKEAQKLAHIGNWDYDVQSDKPKWSEETFKIFERDPAHGEPSWIEHKASIHPDDWDQVDQAIQKAIADGTPYEIEFRILKPDKNPKWAFTIGKADKDANGLVHRLYGTVQDITDRKLIEVELMNAKAMAEENNHLKSALLNNLSHEVRTPMNAIMGFSSLMAEADGIEKDSYAEIIQKSAEHLLALIDDIILISRLQSEKMDVNNISFNPSDLVTEVYQMFNFTDLKKELEVKVKIPEQNLIIQSDSNKIRQVLINLVSNALKYTLQGGVEFGFEIKKGRIEFFVKDTGIGIPEQDTQRIFDTFYRSEKAIFLAIGGNGLGLNIAKELVKLMGGTIGVQSKPDKGSHFYFTIPVTEVVETESANAYVHTARKNNSDLNILVVDDEPSNFQLIKIFLKEVVSRIDHAIDGNQAIEMVSQYGYNLVLMDMKMPGMSGIEATKILKREYPDLTVIVQSAFILPEDKEQAFQAGCNEFVSKPIKKAVLTDIINKYF